jgi:hypothetical protein
MDDPQAGGRRGRDGRPGRQERVILDRRLFGDRQKLGQHLLELRAALREPHAGLERQFHLDVARERRRPGRQVQPLAGVARDVADIQFARVGGPVGSVLVVVKDGLGEA